MIGQDRSGQLSHVVAQRQKQDGGADIEGGVHGGDLSHGARHCTLDDGGDGQNSHQDGEGYSTHDVEHQVDDGGTLGVAVGTHGGKNSGYAGTQKREWNSLFRL